MSSSSSRSKTSSSSALAFRLVLAPLMVIFGVGAGLEEGAERAALAAVFFTWGGEWWVWRWALWMLDIGEERAERGSKRLVVCLKPEPNLSQCAHLPKWRSGKGV